MNFFSKIATLLPFAFAAFCGTSCSDAAYDRIPEKIEGYDGVNLFIFHASWCSYCNAELPLLKRLYSEYSPCGLHVIGINEDDDENIMHKYVKEKEIPFPVVHWDYSLMKKFGHPRSIPTHILIDSSGVIRLRQIGPIKETEARVQIEKALGNAVTHCRP